MGAHPIKTEKAPRERGRTRKSLLSRARHVRLRPVDLEVLADLALLVSLFLSVAADNFPFISISEPTGLVGFPE